MSDPITVKIITPGWDDDDVTMGLRWLTWQLEQRGMEGGYGLGGESGYGVNYENDVFAMRQFYWGDCDCGWEELSSAWASSHKHKDDCYVIESCRIIDASPLQQELEDAIKARNRLPWFGPEQDAAQEVVNDVFNRLRDFKDSVRKGLCEKHGLPWNAYRCTCPHEREWKTFLDTHGTHKPTCSLELPNFLHKPSGFEVRWYKWIGRNNEIKGDPGDFRKMMDECLASVPA